MLGSIVHASLGIPMEFPGSLPKRRINTKIDHFGPDPGPELPGGLPKTRICTKIDHFGPDPARELPGGFP